MRFGEWSPPADGLSQNGTFDIQSARGCKETAGTDDPEDRAELAGCVCCAPESRSHRRSGGCERRRSRVVYRVYLVVLVVAVPAVAFRP